VGSTVERTPLVSISGVDQPWARRDRHGIGRHRRARQQRRREQARLVRRTDRHGHHGIRSNVVAPGLVLRPEDAPVGGHSVWAGGKDALFTLTRSSRSCGRGRCAGSPHPTTSATLVWISSDLAALQITGQVLAVGGGSSMA
jgi:NAD(P)-dependent dehydrogenase (short-subunit alcohol dehydrogenase family)